MRMALSLIFRHLLTVGLVTASLAASSAQQLDQIVPRGLTLGGTTQLTIRGSGFDRESHVVLHGDLAIETQVISASPTELKLQVALSDDGRLQPGIVPLRVVSSQGVSHPVMVGIDRLPQHRFSAATDSLPVALHGELTGEQVLKTTFQAHAGEAIVIDLEGRRLGSNIRPLLRVYSPSNRQVSSARPNPQLHGDARLEFRANQSGTYRIELQDLLYKGPSPGWFRLKIGQLTYATSVYPMAVPSTGHQRLSLVGSNLPTSIQLTTLTKQQSANGMLMIPWDQVGDWPRTGATPCVRLSEFGADEYTEAAVSNCVPQIPLGINGRISKADEVDTFRVGVEPGSTLHAELFAERWGSALDATMEVLDANGGSLLQSDDQDQTTDPAGEFKVPDGMREVVFRVSSVTGSGSREHTYRLAIRKKPTATVSLSLDAREIDLLAGSRSVLQVKVDRQGTVPVRLRLPQTLKGVVRVDSDLIEPEDEQGLWSLVTARNSRGLIATYPFGIVGDDGSETIPLSLANFPGADYQPIHRQQLIINMRDTGRLEVEVVPNEPAYLARGSRLPLDVYLQRNLNDHRPVRLSLVTTQNNRTKKQDNKDVPAPEQELRLAETPTLSFDATHAQLSLVVPSDLPLHSWAFAVKAELLAEDGKTVGETTYSSVHRLSTIDPIEIAGETLPSEQQVKVGTTARLTGRIQRHPDFVFPIRVSLAGVTGVDASVLVPIDTDTFELSYEVPADATPAEFKAAALTATSAEPTERTRDIMARTKTFTVRTIAAK